ncbi:MAG: DUF3829 domain-containing protein [Acidobacteria bacterium]|nr:MAG: DUF3829 domain-containing protein [Acidobacteriota bacterium]REK01842.1 MAG: DUF3829 domain-containing protein [Acidobacteriota bacterium]REK14798.1 MAG: DUF3829 domain-containing protein [Acidobacteriota bacterium]REK45513.1 MAG: DUF3829 domain-containing protein [Acidobacteriota bacterium]
MKRLNAHTSISSLLGILLLLGAGLGCKQITDAVREGTSDLESGSSEEYSADPAAGNSDVSVAAITEKTNLYVSKCYNSYSARIVDSYNRYGSWVKDMDAGPTGNERIIYGLYDVNGDGTDCTNAIKEAEGSDPDLPEVESAASEYSDALADVIKQIRRVHDYYDREDYKDDDFELGKRAHPDLIAAFNKFREANDVFGKRVDELEDKAASLQLEAIKDNPERRFETVVIESGLDAKKFKRLIQEKPYDDITVDDLKPLIDEFEGTIQELKKESKGPMAGMYISECEKFLVAAKELMRRKRDGTPFSRIDRLQIDSGAGWMVEGSPDKVIWAYNQMIQRRKFLRF